MTVPTSGCCYGPLEQLATEKLNQSLSFSKLSQGTSSTQDGLKIRGMQMWLEAIFATLNSCCEQFGQTSGFGPGCFDLQGLKESILALQSALYFCFFLAL